MWYSVSMAEAARLSIDVSPALRTRLKIAAARRGLSLREYCLQAIQERLQQEAEEKSQADRSWAHLSATAFARDWSSEADSV